MFSKSRYLFFIATLFALCLFATTDTYAQSNMVGQLSENKIVNAVVVTTNTPKTILMPIDESSKNANIIENLSVQLQNQQTEINVLRQQIEKLEALLAKNINKTEPVITNPNPNNSIIPPLPNIKASPIAKRAPSELLPDLGHIGAEVGLMIGGSQNPFQA